MVPKWTLQGTFLLPANTLPTTLPDLYDPYCNGDACY